MAWYDDIANTTKGNVQGLVNALSHPVDTAKAQFQKGAPYRQALASALQGDMSGANQALSNSELTPSDFGMMLGTMKSTRIGDIGFDPRFDPRIKEQSRLNNLTTKIDYPDTQIQTVNLTDFVDHPFITGMSDRTNLGKLKEINGVPMNVDLQGGQLYMHNNPGKVWASAKNPVNKIMEYARILKETTGKNPLFIPWRMSPTGGDFANMTGETMLQYMSNNMGKATQHEVNNHIRNFIPNFKGIGSEEGINQFRNAPDAIRKSLKNSLDVNFRDQGGLNIGEARLAVADPSQLTGRDAGIQHIGEIFANENPISKSGHYAYPSSVPGVGNGVLQADHSIFQLLPNVVKERGIINPLNPAQTDIRALQMKPYAGIITDDILKNLGY
jgi:hypothetical protein